MNLLNDPWLSCCTRSGGLKRVSPLQVGDVDLLDIEALRPDFRGALHQLAIGLLQTAFAPKNLEEWCRRYAHPPGEEELSKAFAPYAHAFELQNAAGPAFMQDFALVEPSRQLSVDELLIDAGSDSNLHFNKPAHDPGLCPICFAQALFTLQINAPPGGSGIRTSLRGGGPLTTLLLPTDEAATLWQKLWLNVLPLDALGYEPVRKLGDVLPWMAPARISENGQITTPEEVHPLQAWWSMPRRIRMDASTTQQGQCMLCAASDVPLIRHYLHRHSGTNYAGAWQHPLTPYYLDKKGGKPPISAKGNRANKGYREWLGLVLGKGDHWPDNARVVSYFNNHTIDLPQSPRVRLWCFGYATANMKALCWYESLLPVHRVKPDLLQSFTENVKHLLDAADEMARALHKQVKAAWFSRPGDKPEEPAVQQSFWRGSEAVFYAALQRLAELDTFQSNALLVPIYDDWLRQTYAQVLHLFDDWSMRGSVEELDWKRVIKARAALVKDLNRSRALKPLWERIHRQQEKAAVTPKATPATPGKAASRRPVARPDQAGDVPPQQELFS